MAQSPDHPELRYVQAKGYTRGRPDGPPLWIVVHDMEAGEHSERAENTAAYFANPADGRSVSSHYCADNDSVVQCVRLRDSAWTVGNRLGNNLGINWEFAGFARQTREQWLDDFGLAMFRQAAPIIRADAATYHIPLRRCSVPDLKALRPGITSHNDLRLAFGVTTHTDPGPNFPWDVFMQIITQEAEMEAKDQLEVPRWMVERWKDDPGMSDGKMAVSSALVSGYGHGRAGREDLAALAAKVDALAARLPVDPAALQVAVEAALSNPAVAGALAEAIADEQARRLAE